MIGLDTNVIIRYLTQDDAAQAKKATVYIEKNCTDETPGYINVIVLCEVVWVLESKGYNYSRKQISQVIHSFIDCPQLKLEFNDLVWDTLVLYKDSDVDFSDTLIGKINKVASCKKTVTFDKNASQLTEFMLL